MKKKIRIRKDEIKEMTFEELSERFKGIKANLIQKNYGLVHSGMFTLDELNQEMDIALWKSYRDFDFNKGWVLGTYLGNYVKDIGSRRNKYLNRKKRTGMKVCSIHARKDEEKDELLDFLEDEESERNISEVLSSMVAEELKEDILNVLTNKQKVVFEYSLQGLCDAEIGRKLNVTIQSVIFMKRRIKDRVLRMLKIKWEDLYEEVC